MYQRPRLEIEETQQPSDNQYDSDNIEQVSHLRLSDLLLQLAESKQCPIANARMQLFTTACFSMIYKKMRNKRAIDTCEHISTHGESGL